MECLCDVSSMTCSVQFKLLENQTSDDILLLKRAVSSKRMKLPLNDICTFMPIFVCGALDNSSSVKEILCVRQHPKDQVCLPIELCHNYTAHFTSQQCDFQCSEIVLNQGLPITFSGFEQFAVISENGTCFPRRNSVKNNNSGSGEGTELPLAQVIGVISGTVLVISASVAVATWIMCKRSRTRRRSKNVGEPKSSNPILLSFTRREGFADKRGSDQYNEIEEISLSLRSPEFFDLIDNEGYSLIRDETGSNHVSTIQIEKKARQLPFLPDEQDISPRESLPSTSPLEPPGVLRQNSSAAISSYPKSLTVSTSANVPSIESSNTNTANIGTATSSSSSASSTAVLVSPGKLETSKPALYVNKGSATQASLSSPWQSNPVPHKFPYRPAQYDYLGLVNIRSGHPSLSNQSQLKLVRKKDGNMELVTMQDDVPAVEDLCSGFQLIGLRNGSLCVLGLLAEAPDDDYHKYFKILKLHSDASSYHTSALKPDGDEHREELAPSSTLSTKHAIYLGQLQLESDQSVRSTESGSYLRVVDLAPAEDCSENGGYSRLLDIDEANITDHDGEYLTVLDF